MHTWHVDDTPRCEVKSNGPYLQSAGPAFALIETKSYMTNALESYRYLERRQREMKAV
jgi:hypothetical protein